jgi:hypothetical protein
MGEVKTYQCWDSKTSTFYGALPRPYSCCGWKAPPSSVSGLWHCSGGICGTFPTTPTAFTLTLESLCGTVYRYSNSPGIPFQYTVGIDSLCTEPTGTVVGVVGRVGPGQAWTPAASGNGCSFVDGVYYFTLAGTLVQGGATLQITINAVTI